MTPWLVRRLKAGHVLGGLAVLGRIKVRLVDRTSATVNPKLGETLARTSDVPYSLAGASRT